MKMKETIKYLTELMATVQMAHFKGKLPETIQVDETSDAGISLRLWHEGENGEVVDDGPMFRLADGDARQDYIRIFCVTYDPDDERQPLTFLSLYEEDPCDDAFDISVEQIPQEALEHIAKWLENRIGEQNCKSVDGESNDVTSFFFYMWNKWSEEECKEVFKGCDYKHFWSKWCEAYDEMRGPRGASELFYMMLSDTNRDKLVKRAVEVYEGK